MAIETAKALIEVKADTTQAQKAIRDLASETVKANDTLKKQAEQSSILGKKWEELSKSMVGLQMHDAVKKLSDRLGEATGGVLDLNAAFAGAQVAGPWGAAIGLVGGAVAKTANLMDGLGVSLDELEEKAQKHARTFMPELTGAVWAEHDAINAMNDRLADTPYRLAKVFESFQTLYPLLKKVREEIQSYDSAPAQLNRGLRAGAKGLQDIIGDATTRFLGVSSWGKLEYQKAGKGVSRYGDYAGVAGTDRAPEDSLGFTYGSLGSRASENLDEFGNQTDPLGDYVRAQTARLEAEANSRASRYAEFNKGKETSFLEGTFGKIEEFNLYASAFETLNGAVGASLSAWIDGSMSAGQAFKKFIGEALKGLAVQMAMESLKHGAYALGSLAFGDIRGAAQHGQAALAFGTGAAIAAVAAKEMGGGSTGTSASSSARAPNVTGGSTAGTRDPERIIVYSDAFADDSARGKQLTARKMVERAYGNSAVSHE